MNASLSSRLEVRAARSGDAPAMAALMVRGNLTYCDWAPRFWRPPGLARTQAQWSQRLREEERWTRLAVDRDGDLVALASWCPARPHRDEGAAGFGYVSHLYVDQSLWGNGIARELLRLGEDAMRQSGCAKATLWTPENAPARGFYERCGWRVDGREQWSTELKLPMIGYEKHL